MRSLLFAVLIAAVSLISPAYTADPSPVPDIRAAQEFTLPDLAGNPHSLAEYRKKGPVMLVFYATWCATCLNEIPALKRIYKEYGEKGLQMVAVNVGLMDSLENAQTYALKHTLPYPVLFDAEAAVAKSYGVKSFPRIFLIRPDGSLFLEAVHITEEQILQILNVGQNNGDNQPT